MLAYKEKPQSTTLAEHRTGVYSFLANFYFQKVPIKDALYLEELILGLERQTQVVKQYADTITAQNTNSYQEICTYINDAQEMLRNENSAQGQLALARDKTKYVGGLSIGNSVKPPYESLYLTSNDSLEYIAGIAGFYRAQGYELPQDMNNRCDFIGIELSFMATLCKEEVDAREQNDSPRVQDAFRLQKLFLDEHILLWVPQFCLAAKQAASSQLFKGLMALLEYLMKVDGEAISCGKEAK